MTRVDSDDSPYTGLTPDEMGSSQLIESYRVLLKLTGLYFTSIPLIFELHFPLIASY